MSRKTRSDGKGRPSVRPLTAKSSTARRKRQANRENAPITRVVGSLQKAGHIREADYGAITTVRGGDESPERLLPLGQVNALYFAARTAEELREFVDTANAVLSHHQCTEARCLCGKIARHRDRILDTIALESGITAWLPNPQVQVPGSACGNER